MAELGVQSWHAPSRARCDASGTAQPLRESTTTNAWLQRLSPAGSGSFRLVCFPHAGGSATAFRLWPASLPRSVEILGVQYPGRGPRLSEAPVDRVPLLAREVAWSLQSLPTLPTVFFGHSLGGAVAFEVVRCLAEDGVALPRHLYISSRAAPHIVSSRPPVSHLPDADLLREVGHRYAAVPSELLQYPDVVSLLAPALRADMAAIEEYEGTLAEPIDCPITVVGGLGDPVTTESDLAAWQRLTSRDYRRIMFPGGHFYIDSERHRLTSHIAETFAAISDQASD